MAICVYNLCLLNNCAGISIRMTVDQFTMANLFGRSSIDVGKIAFILMCFIIIISFHFIFCAIYYCGFSISVNILFIFCMSSMCVFFLSLSQTGSSMEA